MASIPPRQKFEPSLYILGERLGMPVYKIRQEMPLYEFIGWLRHFNGKSEDVPMDLSSVKKEDLARMFG